MGTIIKNKLTPKELGDSKSILGAPADQKKILLGTVFGIATGVSRKTVPDPTTETGQKEFEGLSGEFEGVPADPSRDTVQSGTLYLPVIHQQIAGMFKREKDAPSSIRFACEVYSMRDTNKAGYTVVAEAITPLAEADPLGELKKAVADHRAKVKELPKAATVAASGRK